MDGIIYRVWDSSSVWKLKYYIRQEQHWEGRCAGVKRKTNELHGWGLEGAIAPKWAVRSKIRGNLVWDMHVMPKLKANIFANFEDKLGEVTHQYCGILPSLFSESHKFADAFQKFFLNFLKSCKTQMIDGELVQSCV